MRPRNIVCKHMDGSVREGLISCALGRDVCNCDECPVYEARYETRQSSMILS